MNEKMLNSLLQELQWQLPDNLRLVQEGKGIALTCDGTQACLRYGSPVDLARGLVLVKQMGTDRVYAHSEYNRFETLGVMIDCSRNAVLSVENAKRLLRVLALMGYNMVQLYTEDTYEIDGEPYFGYLRGRYSKAELQELDAYAAELGIELMPCIQTLAHLNAMLRWNVYAPVHDCNDILLCGEEKTYELIDKMFAAYAECLRSRRIHIGMDEAHMVGLGKYLDKNGFHDRFDILVAHLDRVCALAKKHDYHPIMWSDMFFRLANHGEYYTSQSIDTMPEGVFNNLPQDIGLVYWDYYHSAKESYDAMIRSHKLFEREIWFACHAGHTRGFTPNNKHALHVTLPGIESSVENKISHVLQTIWGDNGGECSIYAALPTLAYTAALAYGAGEEQDVKPFFLALTNMKYDDFMSIDRLNFLYEAINPATNLFYNDPLLGILDNSARYWQASIDEGLCKALPVFKRCAKHPTYGYLFRTQQSLAAFLQIKAGFGVRLRRAYQSQDRAGLTECLAECGRMLRLLRRFYSDFRVQWMRENKPHGFDVQDIRIGALQARIAACQRILSEYLNGEVDRIAELEEEILPYKGYNPRVWTAISTVNNL